MPKSSKPAPNVGDLVRIVFLDHAEGKAALTFEVIGRLTGFAKESYTVGCWLYVTDVDRAGGSPDNEVEYTIAKAAIKEIKCLR